MSPIEIEGPGYEVRIDPTRAKIRITFNGVMNYETGLAALRSAFNHDTCQPQFGALGDLRLVTQVDLSAQDVIALGKEAPKLAVRPRYGALVTGGDLGRFLMAKLFCGLTSFLGEDGLSRRAFHTLEEAEAWLDSGARDAGAQAS